MEICFPKSHVNLACKYCKPFITACLQDLEAYIYTLEEHVEWLAEDSADIRHCKQIEHVDFHFACSAHPIPSAILMELCIQAGRDCAGFVAVGRWRTKSTF